MAEAIKSALLVDYESLHRSLAGAAGHGDARLADRASAWVAAIETGRLIGPDGTRRRFLLKRCYAGPSVLGKQRDALAAAGFDVVDCSSNDGGGRSSADLYLAMDTIDALAQPNGADEFILLTAASELTPLLTRLKASKRLTTIYADDATAERDKALADALLDGADFAAFLASNEVPASEAKGTASASDRAEIETFARKIHSATNIPLFSPKTYAELFKHLTDEIKANGYHFQTTAKNVADRMTETGRSVTRRQVVFIVKGLALKGHVFSTTDSPDGLAEVFREQARYLITNAGIALDPRQEQLLSAWFVSRATPPAPSQKSRAPAGADAKVAPRPPERPPVVAEKLPQARPTASAKPPTVKPVELPKSAARPPSQMKPAPSPAAREEAKAVIAARIAASARLKPGTRPGSAAKKPPVAEPSQPRSAQPQKRASDQASSDALESSILAAIAEAVDVLVEDGADDEIPSREPAANRTQANNATRRPDQPPPKPADDEEAEGGDIGDQIQRIIASYNRNRTDE